MPSLKKKTLKRQETQRIKVCTIAKDTIIEIGQVSSDSITKLTQKQEIMYTFDLT